MVYKQAVINKATGTLTMMNVLILKQSAGYRHVEMSSIMVPLMCIMHKTCKFPYTRLFSWKHIHVNTTMKQVQNKTKLYIILCLQKIKR